MGVVVLRLVNGFGFRRQARRPGMYFALGIGMIAIYVSITLDMDNVVIVLAALYLALVIRRLALNPARGFRLGRTAVDWVNGRRKECVIYDDIEGVSIGRDIKGQTVCVLRLRNGDKAALPGAEDFEPAQLIHEFGLRGVPVRA